MSSQLVCAVCVFLVNAVFQAPGPEAPQETKTLVAELLRNALADKFKAPFPFKEEKNVDLPPLGRKKIAGVEGSVQFDDPKMKLTVEVKSLKRSAPDEIELEVVASCPMSGQATGEVVGIKEMLHCTARAEVRMAGKVKIVTMGDVLDCTPVINTLEGKISDLKFDKDWAKKEVTDLAVKGLNELIKAKQGELLRDANKALTEAVANDQLKVKLSDLVK